MIKNNHIPEQSGISSNQFDVLLLHFNNNISSTTLRFDSSVANPYPSLQIIEHSLVSFIDDEWHFEWPFNTFGISSQASERTENYYSSYFIIFL